MARPLIAVSASIEELPTAFGAKDCTKLTTAYTNSIYAVGGQPVIMPVVTDPPHDLLDRMDGLLLTGGGDIDPGFYGEDPDPSVYDVRRDRDEFEAALYRQAVARRLPVLAICRGMQLVNLMRGGALVQNITGERNHWQENPGHEPSHPITITPGSALDDALGGTGAGRVNSYHHQALRTVGTDLHVTAMCDDVIEAVEATDVDLVGVQWHPEHMSATDPHQRALFATFVERAAATRNTLEEEMTLCPTT